jgi:hypothetical protein
MVCGIVPSSSSLTTLLPTSTISTASSGIFWNDEFEYKIGYLKSVLILKMSFNIIQII